MRMTLTEARQADEVKARVKALAAKSKSQVPRHIKDLSDAELNEMALCDVARLEGVPVNKSTIFIRMKDEDMSMREAAQTPPRTPRKHKPDQASKKRFHGYGR